MKKLVLLLSIIALTLSSCEGPMGPPGKDIELFREYFTVESGDWKFEESDDNTSFYSYLFDFDITEYTYDKGAAFVFLYRVDSKGFEKQTPVPFSLGFEDRGVKWIEKYDYDFDSGTICFYAACKKGERPPTCEFRVLLAP